MMKLTKLLSTAVLAAGLLVAPLAQATGCAMAFLEHPETGHKVAIIADVHRMMSGQFNIEQQFTQYFHSAYKKMEKSLSDVTTIVESSVALSSIPKEWECNLLVEMSKNHNNYEHVRPSDLRTDHTQLICHALFNNALSCLPDERVQKILNFATTIYKANFKAISFLFRNTTDQKEYNHAIEDFLVSLLISLPANDQFEVAAEKYILKLKNSDKCKSGALQKLLKKYETKLQGIFPKLRKILNTNSKTPLRDYVAHVRQTKNYKQAGQLLQEYLDICFLDLTDYGFISLMADDVQNKSNSLLCAGGAHCYNIIQKLKEVGYKVIFTKVKNNIEEEILSQEELEELFSHFNKPRKFEENNKFIKSKL